MTGGMDCTSFIRFVYKPISSLSSENPPGYKDKQPNDDKDNRTEDEDAAGGVGAHRGSENRHNDKDTDNNT